MAQGFAVFQEVCVPESNLCSLTWKKDGNAGIGIYFGKNSKFNVATYPTNEQTCTHAEHAALWLAIDLIPNGECKVLIVVDNETTYTASTTWSRIPIKQRRKMQYRTYYEVIHSELEGHESRIQIKRIYSHIDDKCKNPATSDEKRKKIIDNLHSFGDLANEVKLGNEEADRLAKLGASIQRVVHNAPPPTLDPFLLSWTDTNLPLQGKVTRALRHRLAQGVRTQFNSTSSGHTLAQAGEQFDFKATFRRTLDCTPWRVNVIRKAMIDYLYLNKRKQQVEQLPANSALCKLCLAAGLENTEDAPHFFQECQDAIEWRTDSFRMIEEYLRRKYQTKPTHNWLLSTEQEVPEAEQQIAKANKMLLTLGVHCKALTPLLQAAGVPRGKAADVAKKILNFLQLRYWKRYYDKCQKEPFLGKSRRKKKRKPRPKKRARPAQDPPEDSSNPDLKKTRMATRKRTHNEHPNPGEPKEKRPREQPQVHRYNTRLNSTRTQTNPKAANDPTPRNH
jgi:ribonuclease HI